MELSLSLSFCVFAPTPSSNLPSLPFSFTPSQLCSLTHSELGQKSGRAAPQSRTPILKLTQTSWTLWPIQGSSLWECGGNMEMVHPAIYSLPQYGFSDLSAQQGMSACYDYF